MVCTSEWALRLCKRGVRNTSACAGKGAALLLKVSESESTFVKSITNKHYCSASQMVPRS